MEKITQYLIQSTVHGSEVRAWEEDIMLPTYEIGKEEKNPIFLEKRVYQGTVYSGIYIFLRKRLEVLFQR